MSECLNESCAEHVEELSIYLGESFGNDTRIDYGTGHEMSFATFLMCLFKVEALKGDLDARAVAVKVFNEYLILARKLQTVYKMEPAGSHGVWSLDDYQFLPFILGSAQLTSNWLEICHGLYKLLTSLFFAWFKEQTQIEPKDFVEQTFIDRYQDENMMFQALKYITTVKNGPFAEHSNQLWNISNVVSWTKVNGGLIKMYHAEVLLKFPVVQHILFGRLVDFSPK